MSVTVFAQADTAKLNKAARKWVKDRVWANGMQLNVHSSVDAAEFYRQYHANKQYWDDAFNFIKTHNLDTLKAGRYPIDGNDVYATVTEGPSKTFEQAKWESHKNYIDLQYVISGKEKIGRAPVAAATVDKPYDPAKDVANYTVEGTFYIAEPGTFFLFFPADAHRPGIKVDGYDVVKKLVIKIKVAQ